MPTTSWVDADFGLRAIPDRTDETGTAVKDISGREDAFIQTLLDRGGTLTPADAFVPVKGTGDFDVDLGSGTADADHYVVGSTVTGQAPFVVRLQQTTATVTLDAADADDRWDQIFLVVRDTTLDGNTDGHTLSRLAYRKGDASTTPTKPGADAEWVHWELIASIYVTGGAPDISGQITDERAASSFLQKLFDDSVQRTGAAVFGKVLDSRYVETGGGDTVTGVVKWTAGQPEIERTDADGNVWLVRIDFPQPDSPRLNVRKNGNLHARFQWDEPNSRWVLTGGLRSTGQLVMNDIINMGDQQIKNMLDPSAGQDAATKQYVDLRERTNPSDGDVYNDGKEYYMPFEWTNEAQIDYNASDITISQNQARTAYVFFGPIDIGAISTITVEWEITENDDTAVELQARGGNKIRGGSADVSVSSTSTFGRTTDTLDVSALSGRGSFALAVAASTSRSTAKLHRVSLS